MQRTALQTAPNAAPPAAVQAASAIREQAPQAVEDQRASFSSIFNSLGSPGDPIENPTRSFLESRFHHDFSKVRVHHDGPARQSASQLNARAWTLGDHIVFGEGMFAPHTLRGGGLLAHELAHVVQQRDAVAPAKAPESRDEEHEEREASNYAVAVSRAPNAAKPAATAPVPMRSAWSTFLDVVLFIPRLFGLEAFPAGQLREYLDGLRSRRGPARGLFSDNMARSCVSREAELGPYNSDTKTWLIQDMLDGHVSGADKSSILTLLQRSSAADRAAITAGLDRNRLWSHYSGRDRRRVEAYTLVAADVGPALTTRLAALPPNDLADYFNGVLDRTVLASVLQVQDRANAAAPPVALPVGPNPVTPIGAVRKTVIQILGDPANRVAMPGLTLQEFKTYTAAQADWFTEPTLQTGGARDDLWRLLLLINEGPHILSGIGDVRLYVLQAVAPADLNPLKAFCRATSSSSPTVRFFRPWPAIHDRIELGRTLLGLEAIIPPATLQNTVSQTQLVDVRTRALLPAITAYWTGFDPFLEQTFVPAPAGAGPEFARVISFTVGAAALGGGLGTFTPLRGGSPADRWVRNLHRFPIPMLRRLVLNLNDTTGAKRLVLVLHTGHDPSAAFQESASLFSSLVLTSPNNLVLMIEGPPTLASVTARVPNITSTWGQLVGGVRRISQLLIAGHGSDQTVGMAGPAGGEQSLESGTPDTQALLNALLTHMDPAQARILYAGCLVGSRVVLAGTAAAAIPAAVAGAQNLGASTDTQAVAAGLPAGRVQAARASVALGAATSLTDRSGRLALQYGIDPNAFGTAQAYASSGLEPEGLLRAAVEVGATNVHLAERLLRTRLRMRPDPADWYDTITRILARIALPAVAGAGINLGETNELANAAEVPFLVRWLGYGITPDDFVTRVNPRPSAARLYTAISGTSFYRTPLAVVAPHSESLRIIVDQGWLNLAGAAQVPVFLAGILATHFTADAFQQFLDPAILAPFGAALLPPGPAPSVERMRLGLAWFALDGANADVRAFLNAQVRHVPGSPPSLTPALRTQVQASSGDEHDLLTQLGFSDAPEAAGGGGGGPTPVQANAAVPGTPARNTLFVTPQPYEAHVIAAPNTTSRLGPRLSFPASLTLNTGDTVHVTGTSGTWRAIDVQGTLRFVPASDLTPPPA